MTKCTTVQQIVFKRAAMPIALCNDTLSDSGDLYRCWTEPTAVMEC